MENRSSTQDTLIDFITGLEKINTGAEANRQAVERLLVEKKGYDRQDIEVDAPISLEMGAEKYDSTIDLVVRVHGVRYMAVKCAPGALDSREREIIAAARLLERYQIPLSAATDGQTAVVWDTVSGKQLGEGLEAIPTKLQALQTFDPKTLKPLDESRRNRQKLIYTSYDSMNIHRSGRLG